MVTGRIPFSRRYDAERPDSGLIYGHVPYTVARGVSNVLYALYQRTSDSWETIIRRMCLETDNSMPPPQNGHELAFDDLYAQVSYLPWNRLCDACEGLYEYFSENDAANERYRDEEVDHSPRSDLAATFQRLINQVFARNYFGYEIREGLVERVGALTQEEVLAEARSILSDPDLAPIARHFQKAQAFFNKRPEPDLENATKEAVSAVEGLARILLGEPSLILSQAIPKLTREKAIPPQLAEMIKKLYAYGGDAEAVRHGGSGQRPQVRLEDAEFALSTSAGAIVYLARLYGRAVQ